MTTLPTDAAPAYVYPPGVWNIWVAATRHQESGIVGIGAVLIPPPGGRDEPLRISGEGGTSPESCEVIVALKVALRKAANSAATAVTIHGADPTLLSITQPLTNITDEAGHLFDSARRMASKFNPLNVEITQRAGDPVMKEAMALAFLATQNRKRKARPRVSGNFITIGALSKSIHLAPKEISKILRSAGYRDKDANVPTQKAISEGVAVVQVGMDNQPFSKWNRQLVIDILIAHQALPADEDERYTRNLILAIEKASVQEQDNNADAAKMIISNALNLIPPKKRPAIARAVIEQLPGSLKGHLGWLETCCDI